MSIRRIKCYVVTCDTCREMCTGIDMDLHFGGPDEATTFITAWGWTVSESGHIHCPTCSAQILCTTLGHLWGPWHCCACKGAIPHHVLYGCPLLRSCEQCDLTQESDLAHLPTTDEPTIPGR